jgi:hypothetical protein
LFSVPRDARIWLKGNKVMSYKYLTTINLTKVCHNINTQWTLKIYGNATIIILYDFMYVKHRTDCSILLQELCRVCAIYLTDLNISNALTDPPTMRTQHFTANIMPQCTSTAKNTKALSQIS